MIDYLEDLLSQVVEEKIEEESQDVLNVEGGTMPTSSGSMEAVAEEELSPSSGNLSLMQGEETATVDSLEESSGLRFYRNSEDVGTSSADKMQMDWSHDEAGMVSPNLEETADVTSPLQALEEKWSQEKQGAVETLYGQMGGSRSAVVETLQRERTSAQVAVMEGGASVTNTRVVEQLVPVETGVQATNFDRYAQRDARRYDGGFTLY